MIKVLLKRLINVNNNESALSDAVRQEANKQKFIKNQKKYVKNEKIRVNGKKDIVTDKHK